MRKMMIILAAVLILGLLTTSVGYAAPPACAPIYHHVRRGETLFSIGRLYGVNPYAIARANHIPNPNRIYACQVLLIPVHDPSPHPLPHPGRIHIVAYGETLLGIARWYGVSAWAIARANGIWNLNCIYAGQRLVIP
jgi:LysM repeat protein